MSGHLLDIAKPARMIVRRIDGKADDLDTAARKLRFQPGKGAEFSGAYRGEVLWV